MSKKLLAAALATVSVVFTGCATSNAVENTQTTVETSKEAEKVEVEEAGTVKVTHTSGETEVAKNPKNVVVFELGVLDALSALDVEVAGVPSSSVFPEYLSQYSDESTYANVGGLKDLDMEAIYELEPELIIIGGRQADYYEELSEIAPTINLAIDNTDYMASFEANMTYLGEIFDKEELVAEKVEAINSRVEELTAKIAEMNVTGLITLANDGAFSVYGSGSRFGIIHDTFGIKPVDESIEASTHGQNASFEYIVEQNPDYVFVVDRSAVAGGTTSAQQLFDNDLIKTTSAYQNDHIIYLDAAVWYTAGGGFTGTEKMVSEIEAALEK